MHTISANNAQCHIQWCPGQQESLSESSNDYETETRNCIEIEIKYSKSNILFKLFKVSQMLINSSENAYIIRMSRYEIREAFKKKNFKKMDPRHPIIINKPLKGMAPPPPNCQALAPNP